MFPFGDSGGTFLWQRHSRSALWPDLKSHQAEIQSGIFRICDDISAERLRREITASDQLNGDCKTSTQKVPPDFSPILENLQQTKFFVLEYEMVSVHIN